MKIAQIGVYFYPVMAGGAEWYMLNLSKELVKRGHEVHVFTTRQGGTKAEEVIEGINVHRLPLWLSLSYRLRIWRGLISATLKQDFDIIHTHDYPQYHSYIATKVSKITNTPLCITVFDVHSLVPRPLYKHIPLVLFDLVFARRILNRADRLLVRAPTLIPKLLRMGVDRKRIRVTPSGIREEALNSFDGISFRRKYGMNGHIILYLGRLHPMKGLQHLLMAAPRILKEFPDTKIVLVGPDPVDYKRHLLRLCKSLNISSNVIFTGPIYDFKKKMQVYAACDIFVLPSGYEGTSQAIFEAMAQAKPVIATNVGGVPYQVKNEESGFLVSYGDYNAIAEASITLLSDERLAMCMGQIGRQRMKGLTYKTLALEMESIYESVK